MDNSENKLIAHLISFVKVLEVTVDDNELKNLSSLSKVAAVTSKFKS